MASGCVPVARNAALASILAGEDLDWLTPAPGAGGLAESVARAARLSPGERTELTDRLRRIVVAHHSLESLADRLVDHLRDLAAARPRRRRDLGARRTGVLP
jgi:glycosyltransferase involved in cell wall biosynthesis